MSEIETVAPILSVIEDGTDLIINCRTPRGKTLGQSVLRDSNGATRVTFIADGEVKILKVKPSGTNDNLPNTHSAPDVKEEFEKTIEPEIKPPRRQIFQDSAAPPSPELAEDYMKEAERQRQEEEELRKQQSFNSQTVEVEQAEESPKPRKRERQLSVASSPCGRCSGSGQVMGDAGFAGTCPVCQGQGQIKSWGRRR